MCLGQYVVKQSWILGDITDNDDDKEDTDDDTDDGYLVLAPKMITRMIVTGDKQSDNDGAGATRLLLNKAQTHHILVGGGHCACAGDAGEGAPGGESKEIEEVTISEQIRLYVIECTLES